MLAHLAVADDQCALGDPLGLDGIVGRPDDAGACGQAFLDEPFDRLGRIGVEPTSGLDADATEAVEGLIKERLAAGASVIWSTHDAVQAKRVAGRALVIRDGKVSEQAL